MPCPFEILAGALFQWSVGTSSVTSGQITLVLVLVSLGSKNNSGRWSRYTDGCTMERHLSQANVVVLQKWPHQQASLSTKELTCHAYTLKPLAFCSVFRMVKYVVFS